MPADRCSLGTGASICRRSAPTREYLGKSPLQLMASPADGVALHTAGVSGRFEDPAFGGFFASAARETAFRPRVALGTPRRAEGEIGRAVLERHRRRQSAARALAWSEARRLPLLEPEHLHPRAETKAELGDHRRALQPAAARRCRHHVPPAVDDIDVAGVAGDEAMLRDGRLPNAAKRRLANPSPADLRLQTADEHAGRATLRATRA